MISRQQKLDCAKRELNMRFRVYRRFVARGMMSPEQATHEIAVMSAIVEDYERSIQGGVFDANEDSQSHPADC